MERYLLEGCVDSVESAVIATKAGANRLELCGNLMIGGTTPTKAVYEAVREHCQNRVHVLIRPRFGDFCYSDTEFQICVREVKQFRELGADGVVIGILRPDGTLNLEQMKQLREEAQDMSVTLHRAFDVCADPYQTLEEAIHLKIHTILTSGQRNTCLEGMDCIRRLKEQSGGRIDIMAGSGVNSKVIRPLVQETGITSFHMSGKKVLDSPMHYRKKEVHMGLDSLSEYEIWQTDAEQIQKAVKELKLLSGNQHFN